jgi:uncharacterized protein (TIGR02147 family)
MPSEPTAQRTRRRSPIDVFRYLDYRRYLADYYSAKKSRGFSYRAFSRAAGLGAPNYLKLVIGGQRNLTAAMAARFAAACGLSGEAAGYFTQLVEFNQARSVEQRNRCYARLVAFSRYRRGHKLEVAQAAYHATWYTPAIRELAASERFREDPDWIADVLWPKIKSSEAKHALDTLIALGLLERDPHGRLRQSSAVVSTGPETLGMHIANYHAEMMRRATAAMELVPAASRDVSALTFCVGPEGLAKLKQRIREIRRELIELVEAESERSQVVQLNLQLFPLSRPVSPAGKAGRAGAAKRGQANSIRREEGETP